MTPPRLTITGDQLTLEQAGRLVTRIEMGDEAACWPWHGSHTPDGYGQVVWRIAGQQVRLQAHRLAWEWWNGRRIPDGYEIDHTCTRRDCCNPKHLQPVSHAENMRRTRRTWREWRDRQLALAHIADMQNEVKP